MSRRALWAVGFSPTEGQDSNSQARLKFQARLEISSTEYDRAKVPPYNGSDPMSPLEV